MGTLSLFFIVQKPESILNRKSSQETINRERAAMVLSLIKNNKDSKDILVRLKVIEKSYPDADSKWIKDLIFYFTRKSEFESDKEKQESWVLKMQSAEDWSELQILKDSIANIEKNKPNEIELLKGLFQTY